MHPITRSVRWWGCAFEMLPLPSSLQIYTQTLINAATYGSKSSTKTKNNWESLTAFVILAAKRIKKFVSGIHTPDVFGPCLTLTLKAASTTYWNCCYSYSALLAVFIYTISPVLDNQNLNSFQSEADVCGDTYSPLRGFKIHAVRATVTSLRETNRRLCFMRKPDRVTGRWVAWVGNTIHCQMLVSSQHRRST